MKNQFNAAFHSCNRAGLGVLLQPRQFDKFTGHGHRWSGPPLRREFQKAAQCLNDPIPYNEGSIQYWKEKGRWTKDHEEWQQKQLGREKARQDAWPRALQEAQAKGLKTTIDNLQWQQLWRSYLDKIE